MADYQSIHTGAIIDAAVSAVVAGQAGIQGVKVNGTALTPDDENKVDVTVPGVVQTTGQSTTNVMSQKAVTDAIAGGGGVTVVQTIGSSTTSVMSQNAVTEVSVSGIKVNGLELTKDSDNKYSITVPTVAQRPGSSTTEVMSQNAVTSELDGKLGSEDIVQITGTSTTQVMSQKAVTDSLPNIVQTTGTSTTDVMSQKAVTDAISGGGGGVTIVQTIGESTTSVMSQKAVTDVSISGFYVNGNEILKTNSNTYEIEVPTVTNRAGDSPSIAMSQKAVTDGLASKVDTSSIVQTTGTSTTNIMSQKAVTDAIAGGGGVTVVQTTGQSTTSVMSQKAVTDNLDGKVDVESGKGLSTNDYTTAEKTKLSNIETEANKTVVVQDTGTSTTSVMSQKAVTDILDEKVDVETGKGLSTNDYTSAEKTKLSNIETEANKTVVVQSTGTSTTSVMSQKAVTDELDAKAEIASYTATLSSSGWTGDYAPYTQTVNITGILSTDVPIIDISSVTQSSIDDWSCVSKIETANGSITATCLSQKPSNALSLNILTLR